MSKLYPSLYPSLYQLYTQFNEYCIQVNEVDSDWEEAQFHLANYYYKWSKAVTTGVKQSMLPHVIKHYGESLKYGSNNIFQSMPRLLTTWFELEGWLLYNLLVKSRSL